MIIKEDCFAFYDTDDDMFDCSALTALDCKNCKFYKSNYQFINELKEIHGGASLNKILEDYAIKKESRGGNI